MNPYSAGIDFRRHFLTHLDVRTKLFIIRWESNPFLDGDSINISAPTYNIGSDSIIEGALISVGGKKYIFVNFHQFFFSSVIITIIK